MKTNRSDEGVSGARKKRRKVPDEAGVAAEVTEVKAEAERETVLETKTGVPPCPVEDPRYGDKTAAVVAWFKEYRPEEFMRRYAGRRFF